MAMPTALNVGDTVLHARPAPNKTIPPISSASVSSPFGSFDPVSTSRQRTARTNHFLSGRYRVTPAMVAGVVIGLWTIDKLFDCAIAG